METKRELAERYFLEGYNCAQSVFLAFCAETGLGAETAALLAGGFGGGMGRLREMCGAVSGAVMALGCMRGYAQPGNDAEKARLYAEVQELVHGFERMNGSHVCRELLGETSAASHDCAPTPERRTPEYYAARPCPHLVGDAAELLERMLEKRKE